MTRVSLLSIPFHLHGWSLDLALHPKSTKRTRLLHLLGKRQGNPLPFLLEHLGYRFCGQWLVFEPIDGSMKWKFCWVSCCRSWICCVQSKMPKSPCALAALTQSKLFAEPFINILVRFGWMDNLPVLNLMLRFLNSFLLSSWRMK